ncbi:MAG: hypothetical protein AAF462_04545 [Thermodesulfobacteriota bacterium]
MRYLLLLLLVFGLFVSFSAPSDAQLPKSDDFVPVLPSECEGLNCKAYGICDTYCEDLECDTKEGFEKNPDICTKVLEKYQEKTGYPGPPCICTDVCFDEQVECKSECKPTDLDCLSNCCAEFSECQQDCCDQDGVRNCIPEFCAVAP